MRPDPTNLTSHLDGDKPNYESRSWKFFYLLFFFINKVIRAHNINSTNAKSNFNTSKKKKKICIHIKKIANVHEKNFSQLEFESSADG